MKRSTLPFLILTDSLTLSSLKITSNNFWNWLPKELSFSLITNCTHKKTVSPCEAHALAPTFAYLFLCHHEKLWLDNCPSEFKPVLYRRYVDDTFLLFTRPHHVQLFLNYLNSQHPNIEFTAEIEENSKLSFLDATVSKDHGMFVTSVYRKSTFTGL